MFEYNLNISQNIIPIIIIGPEVSFLRNAKTEYIDYGRTLVEYNVRDDYKSVDYGVIIGIGLDYILSTGKIIFDTRYYYG